MVRTGRTQRDGAGKPGNMEGWPSGLRRRPAKALDFASAWVRIPLPPLNGTRQYPWKNILDYLMGRAFRATSRDLVQTEGGVVLIGKAPHSKCGVRKHLGVRVPPPPLNSSPVALHNTEDGDRGVHIHGAWLSPVERCVRVAEVPGSNPGAPIMPELKQGRVAEWLKAHDWKSCGHPPTWVRIPPRPSYLFGNSLCRSFCDFRDAESCH